MSLNSDFNVDVDGTSAHNVGTNTKQTSAHKQYVDVQSQNVAYFIEMSEDLYTEPNRNDS